MSTSVPTAFNQKGSPKKVKSNPLMPSKKITSPHVTGHTIEHSGTDGMPIRTNMGAVVSHGTLRLEIKSGSAAIKILASDWDFFKKQGDELLGKRRLLESATK